MPHTGTLTFIYHIQANPKKMIKEEFIQELKERADIVTVIGEYVELKKKGASHVGLCAFHTEKTPSFTVSKSKGIFKCMGCGKGGDVFKFLELHRALEFPEQVKEVARIMNIPVQYEESKFTPEQQKKNKEKKDKKEILYIQNQKYWEAIWNNGQQPFPVKKYTTNQEGNFAELTFDLFGKEFSYQTIKEFGLAVAPVNLLSKQGKKMGFDEANLFDGGLICKSEKGKYDRFSGRLLFPIYVQPHSKDRRGKIAGFGGRVDPNDPYKEKKVKYINSPETAIYDKSKILYGLRQAAPYIQKSKADGSVYLVEGYTDMLAMYDHGIKNVVAKCGTALTKGQAALLKKYAREVILIPDTDPKFDKQEEIIAWPGLDAMTKPGGDIDVLIDEQLNVKILILPIPPVDETDPDKKRKIDPDDFIRIHKKDGFDFYRDENVADAIEWRVKRELEKGAGLDVLEKATEIAVSVLSRIKSEYKRNGYLKTFCGAKYLKTKDSILSKMVLDKMMEGKTKSKGNYINLSGSQEHDHMEYGIFVGQHGNWKKEVFMKLEKGWPVALCNFNIIPEYHILSENDPGRRIRIVNRKGLWRVLNLHTDIFEDFNAFRKAVAGMGDFKFYRKHCKNEDFDSIVTKLYEEMPTAISITKLGQHPMGFYCFANGVVLEDGHFRHMQENGLITVSDETYRLPGKSEHDEQMKKLDGSKNIDPHLEHFLHIEGDCPSWESTVSLFHDVHQENGLVGIAYYLLCLFRSEIYPKYTQEFPILNGTGPPQKGKTQLFRNMSGFFGIPEKPVNLSNVTQFGLSTIMEQRRDAFIGLDEYLNGLDEWKIQFIKDISDGAGRLKGSGKNSNSTSTSEMLNGVYVFGQELPTRDIATLTRMVSMWFKHYDDSEEAITNFEKLKAIRQSGVLSQHTARIQRLRPHVKANILDAFYHCKSELKGMVGNLNERVINSHAWLMAIVFTVQDELKFPEIEKGKLFYETFRDIMAAMVTQQVRNIKKEDETSDFFLTFMDLVMSRGLLRYKTHFLVEIKDSEKFYETKTSKDTDEHTWEKPRKLIYIHLESVFTPYKNNSSKTNLSIEGIRFYLEQNPFFLGMKKAKKIGKVSRMVMVFSIGEVEGNDIENGLVSLCGFDLPTTKEAVVKFAQEQEGDAPEDDKAEKSKETGKGKDDDLPF